MRNGPRLRMFAGPNGSGKTTIKNGLRKPSDWFGIYINPDDLENSIRQHGFVATDSFPFEIGVEELRGYFDKSVLLQQHGLAQSSALLHVEKESLCFPAPKINSYFASVLADFLRRKALAAGSSFSFETVMSAPDKVELLEEAQNIGYRTYLYFVATASPEINIARVDVRVKAGGHSVPREKNNSSLSSLVSFDIAGNSRFKSSLSVRQQRIGAVVFCGDYRRSGFGIKI